MLWEWWRLISKTLKKQGRCVLNNKQKKLRRQEQIILYFRTLERNVFYMEGWKGKINFLPLCYLAGWFVGVFFWGMTCRNLFRALFSPESCTYLYEIFFCCRFTKCRKSLKNVVQTLSNAWPFCSLSSMGSHCGNSDSHHLYDVHEDVHWEW